jgi:hypothetical protein
MRKKLVRNSKVVIAIAAVLLITVLVGVFCVNGNILFGADEYSADDYSYTTRNSILLRTDRMIYEKDDFMVGVLVNLSSHPIEIRSDEPLIYELSEFGWLPPMGTIWTMLSCPDALEKGWVQPGYASHAILQRQSGEGTWQVLRPDRAGCKEVGDPIRIGPRRTAQLFVGEGYLPLDELEAGIYRWHLVNYIDPFPECNAQPGCYLSGAHLFTETFEW